MNKYLAHICGHYSPIGYEELYASLEAEGIKYEVIQKDQQIIIFETDQNPTKASSRCAFLHSLILLLDEGEITDDRIQFKDTYDSFKIEKNKTFCVRVRRIGKKVANIKTVDLERKLGSYIYSRFENNNLEVNLKNPNYLFISIVIEYNFFLGLELWSIDRKDYYSREPAQRKYFRPGAMKTDFARAIVNLSRVKNGEIFFDPFCGGGGFLLEASDIGAFAIGSDVDFEAIVGAKRNLTQYHCYNTSLYRGDSRFSAIKEVDAIATDPPYSTQSSTHGEKLSTLIYEFLIESKNILKTGKYLVFSTPSKAFPEKIVEKTEYKVVKLIDCVIHKSLTRRILVLK